MKLVLCRHGETDFNFQKRLQGRMETSLNETGREQARTIAEALKGEKFDAIFCSPQKRCVETAEEIMKFHLGNKLVFRDELKEIDIGKYVGMNPHEIEGKFPGIWAKRVDNKYDFIHEGGESYASMDKNRVKPLLQEFREKYSGRKILAITHQGTIRLMLGNMLGLPPDEKMRVYCPNSCIYYVEYLPHRTTVKYLLASTGETGNGYIMRGTGVV